MLGHVPPDHDDSSAAEWRRADVGGLQKAPALSAKWLIRVDLSPARHLELDDVSEPPEGLRAEVVGLQPSEGLADRLLASDSEVAPRRVIHVLHGEVDDVAALVRHRAIDGEAI